VRIRGLCAAALVVALTISACSSGPQTPPPAGGNAEVGKTNDLNPQDPSTLQDGGALRLALTAFLENFNPLHIDGNMADAGTMLRATMPRAFRIAADGTATVNTDFLNDVELTSTSPQVVTYTINPKAVWSDGTPITWEDIKSQIDATDTKNKDFVIAGPNGADRVGSVTRGVDDRQAIMTFAKPYADWKGLFAGNGMLLPKAVTATPEAFNKGFLTNPSPSAGRSSSPR
jgi:peptide/nickel transport system substrate-binding protein